MADNLCKLPVKGILKNSTSFEGSEGKKCPKGAPHFDELNIMATHHPPDKDYGHMKIEEPKTPYSYSNAESGDEADGVDPETLADRIKAGASELPKVLVSSDEEDLSDQEEIEETEEERAKRLEFEKKRKAHYNEYTAVKLARQLLMDDEEEEDEMENGTKKEGTMETEAEDQKMDTHIVD